MADYAIQYLAEEHAPDPVHTPGDPTLPGKVGIWLFLASEIMFFVAILGSYIIYRTDSLQLFAKNAEVLNKWLAATNTVVLIFSSLTMALAVDASQKKNAKRTAKFLAITIACAFGFLVIKYFEYSSKFHHLTFQVARHIAIPSPATAPTSAPAADASTTAKELWTLTVYDGHVHKGEKEWTVDGYAYTIPAEGKSALDLHWVTEADVKAMGKPVKDEKIDPAEVRTALDYGPSRNTFFSSYFTLTGVHGVHVVGGIIPLTILLVQALRGKTFGRHTEYTGLYWHFVDLVWIFLFPLLYLI